MPAAVERPAGAAPRERLTLKKRDVLKMLMTMDRYQVDSVIIKPESDSFNWEIPLSRWKAKKKPKN
ncbi:MAG TPA: hypothetical protein VL404_03735 [Candidatus Eisenbacteria bacterium]|nr:hypothetical protein [Candidatus Eisenbacteria bacterium]